MKARNGQIALFLLFVLVVIVLLTLLHLGIQGIRLGPTLPAFLSPNVLNFLAEHYAIAPTTTPEADLAALLS